MAHVAYFKIDVEEVDVIPGSLSPDVNTADLKALLVDLYTNEGGAEAVGQGKAIFANTEDGIYAPVFVVNLFVIQYDAVAEGEHHLVFHLHDVSSSFRIAVPE